jgi:DNA polymerase-3 subunit gamma/tau
VAEETYQSLYRRYRPTRFAEVLGQNHVTHALRNAVRDGRVGQGYLFSGPRGTGKTSTARILAKALNCESLDDGEPCGTCESCVSVAGGSSFAVIEMDAASNNGVDAMRDLVSKASLGTTGLRKVYIIDEVHMLSAAASNTLLKTLEEPPSHVVFVLATTDPQKVLPTIISRVQHFQFHLLAADTLGSLVRSINADAALGLDEGSLDKVVRRGAGSARDALSVLDQAAALGGAEDEVPVAAEILEALVERDPARALTAVAGGCAAGRDPRRLAEETLSALRDAFLAGRAPALVDLPPAEVEQLADLGRRLGAAALVRAMETIGSALTDMREALEPRVTLEVALVRVTAPEADVSPGALLERLERLERRLEGGAAGAVAPAAGSGRAERPQGSSDTPRTPAAASGRAERPQGSSDTPRTGVATQEAEVVEAGPSDPAAPAAPTVQYGPRNLPKVPPAPGDGRGAVRLAAAAATPAPVQPGPPPPPPGRRTLGSVRAGSRAAAAAPPATATPAPAAPAAGTTAHPPAAASGASTARPAAAAGAGALPSRDELTKAWGDTILGSLHPRARSRFAAGRFLPSDGERAVFALPGAAHRDQCLPLQGEVEAALAAHFGGPVPLRLVAEEAPAEHDPMVPDDDESTVSVAELRDAPRAAATSPADRVKSAFPGVEEVQR